MNIRQLLDQPRNVFEGFCKQNAHYAYLGNSEGLCTVLCKYRMYVDTRDISVVPHLILDGTWEPWVTLALLEIKRGHAVDIGANHGYFTLILADLCGSVTAFEPQEDLVEKIQQSVGVNGFYDDVVVEAMAVGEQSGKALLVPPERGDRDYCSYKCKESKNGIPMTSLDDYFEEGKEISFIKIDAEGFEEKIWKGMQRIVKDSNPTILLEFTPGLYEDAEGFLKEIQAWYPLAEVGTDAEVRPVTEEEIMSREFSMLWLEKSK